MTNKNKCLAVAVLAAMLTGCADPKTINGVLYEPYGLANAEARKDPKVNYEIPAANFFAGFLFSESIVVPGYIVLFDLYEPVSLKETAEAK